MEINLEKLEMIRLPQESGEWRYHIPNGYTAEIADGFVVIRPKESEDERNEKIRKQLISSFDYEMSKYGNVEWEKGISYREVIVWLEKRKEQKPEWSEEEKKKLNRIYQVLGWAMDEHAFWNTKRLIGDKEGVELQDFLRSIAKPKEPCWKPSEEQMRCLQAVVQYVNKKSLMSTTGYSPAAVLQSLYIDLKALM